MSRTADDSVTIPADGVEIEGSLVVPEVAADWFAARLASAASGDSSAAG